MKKIIVFALLLTVSASSFSQQTNPSTVITKQDYLKKSKTQKVAAWALLGGGVALGVGGVIWATSNIFSTSSGPDILFAAGGASLLGSIPLFIASSRNKHKANAASAYFKMESSPAVYPSASLYRTFPVVALKISL
jgi:hypothetical protein